MPELPRQHERRSAPPAASAGSWNPIARAAIPAPPPATAARSATPPSSTPTAPCACRRIRPSPPQPNTPPAARAQPLALPLLRRPRRPAMLRLPRLDARRVSQLARQRQPAQHRPPGPRGRDVRMHRLPHQLRPAPSPAVRTACTRLAQAWVSRHPDALENGQATAPNARPATAQITAAPSCRACRPTAR